MPFTLAHPAAVLFLGRAPLSLLALASGAIAPDLPYYLRVAPLQVTADSWYEPYVNATTSHSLGQLVPVALPLALILYLCGRLVLPPLRSIAGVESPGRSPSDLLESLGRGAWIVVSLAIGVLTHLAWDALTEVAGPANPLLQHGSTAVGLLVVAVFVFRRRTVLRWHDPVARRSLAATALISAVVALVGALVAGWSWLDPAPGFGASDVIEGFLTDGAKGAGAGLVAAAAALALGWWAMHLVKSAGRRVDN